MNNKNKKIVLPTLKGTVGDWLYYTTVITFEEVSKRVFLPKEIDAYNEPEKQLSEWIQRELDNTRTAQIVHYLNEQPQRFFNSLILGIYGGSPSWQEIEVSDPNIDEDALRYLSSTMGILTLSGEEHIFAIDGQHRTVGIRKALEANPDLAQDEITAIFVAHKTDKEGILRTQKLFSTLNRDK